MQHLLLVDADVMVLFCGEIDFDYRGPCLVHSRLGSSQHVLHISRSSISSSPFLSSLSASSSFSNSGSLLHLTMEVS